MRVGLVANKVFTSSVRMIAFVVDCVRQSLDYLQKEKNPTKEWGHVVLIGWTDRSISFIEQICIANESQGGVVIVVLADESKSQIESEIESSLDTSELRGCCIRVRSGSPFNPHELRNAACETAKCTVILSSSESADAWSLRIVIALKIFPKLDGHVVVEVFDKEMEYLMKVRI
jgi:hypothetical protein